MYLQTIDHSQKCQILMSTAHNNTAITNSRCVFKWPQPHIYQHTAFEAQHQISALLQWYVKLLVCSTKKHHGDHNRWVFKKKYTVNTHDWKKRHSVPYRSNITRYKVASQRYGLMLLCISFLSNPTESGGISCFPFSLVLRSPHVGALDFWSGWLTANLGAGRHANTAHFLTG